MNNISELDNKKCTGCMACKNICPQKCINITTNELEFEYPQIDQTKCIQCGMCSKICPELNNSNKKNKYEMVFAAINKDFESWKNSSSGGAFKALCEKYCNMYPLTTIYGASYNTGSMTIKHIGVKLNNINYIQKSKYVQSNMENVYDEITVKMKNNENIIFSGTPCQNLALKNFLKLKNVNENKILFIDFICHGVGSPKTFKESLKKILKEKKINSAEVLNVNHRGKKVSYFDTQSYNTEIITKSKVSEIKKNKDLHFNLFFQKLNCRESCEECSYANENRCSDITIADFKKFYHEFPKVKSKKNASTIIIHTEKGKQIFNETKDKFDIYQSNINVIKNNNPIYFHSIKCNEFERRNKFIEEFKIMNDSNKIICMSKYANKTNFKNTLKHLIPEPLRAKLKFAYSRWRKKQ